jgi:hypothetical protein
MAENTLNFAGDGDDVDAVAKAENMFGVKIADHEAADTRTVGQLYDLILSKRRALGPTTRTCLTQTAFYRLRRALNEMGSAQPVTPRTPLAHVLPPPANRKAVRLAWQELAERTGLTLPRREAPRTRFDGPMSKASAVTFWGCGSTLFVALAIALTELTGIHFLVVLLAQFGSVIALVMVTENVFATIPHRIATVGDLAHETAGHSFAELQRQRGGASPSDLWDALIAMLRNINGHKLPISRETTFFAKT